MRALLASALLVVLLAVLPTRVDGQSYVVLDLSSARGRPPPIAGQRGIGLAADDIGAPWSTATEKVEIQALPLANEAGCEPMVLPARLPTSKPIIVLARRGNCTFVEKFNHAQKAGAYGLLIVNYPQTEVFEMSGNHTAISSGKTRAAMIDWTTGEALIHASLGQPASAAPDATLAAKARNAPAVPSSITGVTVHAYVRQQWDVAFLLMLVIACATVMFGAYLSASEERRARSRSDPPTRSTVIAGEEALPTQYLTMQHALMFIVMASGTLVVLFFFIKYLIYVLIFLFCVGSLQAVTHLGTQFLRWLAPSYTGTIDVPVLGHHSVYSVLSFTLGLVMAVSWAIIRNRPGAWFLQDVLGVSLLITLQQSLRLPDIKVSTILLSMAFFYDIFWVFLVSS
jgi:signal peptide peptidase-like protein 2B